MLKKVVARVYLTILALAMVAAAITAFAPYTTSAESGTCCTTSGDCPGQQLCYVPSGGLTDCSQGRPNYCRDAHLLD